MNPAPPVTKILINHELTRMDPKDSKLFVIRVDLRGNSVPEFVVCRRAAWL
jgi:hypothetical protein